MIGSWRVREHETDAMSKDSTPEGAFGRMSIILQGPQLRPQELGVEVESVLPALLGIRCDLYVLWGFGLRAMRFCVECHVCDECPNSLVH